MTFQQIVRDSPGYLLKGTLITVPLALTMYILYSVFRAVDQLLPVGVPGLGLVLTLILVGLVGFSSSNVIGHGILESTERFLTRVPLVKLVYTSIKDLINAFVGDKKRFDMPVLLRPSADAQLRLLGFVTRDNLAGLNMPHYVSVYVPQSYNFAGNLVLVPKEFIEPLNISSSEVMTFIVSGGISGLGVGPPLLPANYEG